MSPRLMMDRPRPGPLSARPEQIVADRGYDSRRLRRALGRRGIRTCIPPIRRAAPFRSKGRPPAARREDYARRWLVERTFAWLGNFRRLLVRWERHLSIYRGFFTLAVILVCLRRLRHGRGAEAPVRTDARRRAPA